MAENVENIMLEHLKRFQATLERIERTVNEHTARLANLEGGQAAIIQHLSHFASADAAQQLAIDNVSLRLDRIERRLELSH
jgi:O-acetylhomoserine/O-acetylserine sulfhydrylase-like pyridoxal-dependent enzyme